MGVYIKGMEMPKACSNCFAERCIGSDFGCDILGFDDANTTCFTNERRKDCPLVSVPPHGKMVDIEPFMRGLYEEIQMGQITYTSQELYDMMDKEIKSMPTIIEAEEGET